ncbi:MAG: MaoC family dehydratase [Pseudomonadales bacterium]|nr:MaoC family dehydratase [Pseudomonadales bacterium]
MLYFEDIELNRPVESRAIELSKEEIIRFATEWDPQPFHIDEEAANQWPLGLTASGLHTIAVSVRLNTELGKEPSAVIAGLGWDELRLPRPVFPGDSLRVRSAAIAKRESRSKPDRGIVQSLVEVLNQRDEVVLSYKVSAMMMRKPSSQ